MPRCLICLTTFWCGASPGESEPCDCGRNLTRADLQQDETLNLKALREEWQREKASVSA